MDEEEDYGDGELMSYGSTLLGGKRKPNFSADKIYNALMNDRNLEEDGTTLNNNHNNCLFKSKKLNGARLGNIYIYIYRN